MENTNRMMALFQGQTEGYGTYELPGEAKPGVKHTGKAITKRGKVTEELWQDHLEGKQGIGIVPIVATEAARRSSIRRP